MADEKIVTSIVANSDFSNLIADVQRVTSSLFKLQQEFAGANRALAGQIDATNAMFNQTMLKTGQFSSHFVSLTSDVEKFGRNLDSGRLKLRDYFRVYQEHNRTSGGLIRDLAKQQVQLQNAVLQPLGKNAQGLMQYNVHIPRGLDITKNKSALLRQELQIMNKVIQDGGVQLINWGKNTQWAGRQLTVGLTLPLAAFGKAAADAFKTADQELTRLTKVYGDVAGTSAQELSRIRDEVSATAKELSSAMGVNFSETIALAADIAATGKTGDELLSSISETTRLAVLGEVDRQEAMKATLAIQTAFKQNTEELSQSINFLNAVENQTSTTLNDLVTAIPKAGPVVRSLGGDIQDLALYLTAMREGGINASEAANAIKSGLASLINPTKQTVGLMKDFGIDILGMVKANAGDTTSLLLDLQSALDQLDPLSKAQAIEQMFGKFQFARISALLNNLGREGSQTLQVLDLMGASVAELEQVAGRELAAVTESAAGRFRRAVEGLKADLAGVGEDFLNIGTKLINVLSGILDFAQKLPDPIKKVMAFGGAFTAIIGPVIMLTGVLANFFGYIIKGLGHFKALFKGAEGFRLLTPEIIAARNASSMLSDEFYSDAKAADTLRLAIEKLNQDLVFLQQNALNAKTSTENLGRTVATAAGTPILAMGGPRVVDPTHPLLGPQSRASAHLNPRNPNDPSSIFGLTLQPIPVNRRLGANPQILMSERLPDVPGLTTVGGVSTGVVAGEHARYAALMATLGTRSRQEIEQLKKTIGLGGQVSRELIDTFDDILPITQRLTNNAARQSAAIVAELKAGTINVQQARAQIIAVNADLERMMGAEITQYAALRGRTIDLTKAPLIDQPVVDPMGKPNLRGMFRQGNMRDVMEALGRATKTRTLGGPYSIETTRPRGFNQGGQVYNSPSVVPGPNVNADIVPAMLTPGEFVVNRESTAANLPLLQAINNGGSKGPGFNRGSRNPLQGLQRGHISNDLSAFLMYMDADVNQRMVRGRTYQGYDGITGFEIANSLESMRRRTGIHPASILSNLANEMGGEASLVDDFYNELIKDLKSPSNASRIFGGTRGESFEDFTDSRLSKLRGIRLPGGSNLHDELRRIRTVRGGRGGTGRTVGLERDGRAYGGSNVLRVDPSRRAPRQASAISRALLGTRGGFQTAQIARLIAASRGIRFNSGGMVPGYNRGGGVVRPGRKYYGEYVGTPLRTSYEAAQGRFANEPLQVEPALQAPETQFRPRGTMMPMISSMIGFQAGSALGARFGQTGSMIGGLAGSMLAPSILNSFSRSAQGAAEKGNILSRVLKGIGAGFTRTNLIIGGTVAAVGLAVAAWKKYNETQRISAAAFGLTADSAEKAGLKFTDYNTKVKDAIAAQKLMIDQNMLTYESLQSAGTPFKMTIAEYKKLRKELKETMAEQIKVINATSRPDAARVAVQLKEQLMAAGLSAEEAAKRIYTLFNLSDKAGMAVSVINTDAFKGIIDAQTAAASALQSFNYAKNFENTRDAAAALNTALTAINTGVEDYIAKSEKAAKKKGQEFNETEARYKAEQKMLDIINSKVKNQESIGQGVLNQLKKQNPEIEKFVRAQDTAVSVFQKLQLVARGFTGELANLNAQQVDAIYKLQIATAQAVETVNQKGLLSQQYKAYNDLKKQRDDLAAAAKGQSVQEQIDAKERLKAIDKEIKKINDKAEARKKALREEAQAEDMALRIQQQKLEYEKAVAAGDFGGAATAKIELQRLQNEQQVVLTEQQIEQRRLKDVAPLEREKERLQNAQEALANKAALAAESLESINKRLATQKEKIDAVNASMAALKLALDINKDNIEQYKTTKEFQGLAGNLVDAVKKAGISVPDYTYTGGAQGVARTDIGQYALETVDKYAAEINTIVAKQGIVVKATGDIIIDGKSTSTKTISAPDFKTPSSMFNATGGFGQTFVFDKKVGKWGYVPNDKITKDMVTYQDWQSGKRGYAGGGLLSGPGTGTSDSILGMYANGGMVRVSNGEYIINAATVSKLGVPFFDRINGMKNGGLMLNYDVPKYGDGGMLQTIPYRPDMAGTTYKVGSVTMQFAEAPANGKQLFEEFKMAMALEQKKTTPNRNMNRRYA